MDGLVSAAKRLIRRLNMLQCAYLRQSGDINSYVHYAVSASNSRDAMELEGLTVAELNKQFQNQLDQIDLEGGMLNCFANPSDPLPHFQNSVDKGCSLDLSELNRRLEQYSLQLLVIRDTPLVKSAVILAEIEMSNGEPTHQYGSDVVVIQRELASSVVVVPNVPSLKSQFRIYLRLPVYQQIAEKITGGTKGGCGCVAEASACPLADKAGGSKGAASPLALILNHLYEYRHYHYSDRPATDGIIRAFSQTLSYNCYTFSELLRDTRPNGLWMDIYRDRERGRERWTAYLSEKLAGGSCNAPGCALGSAKHTASCPPFNCRFFEKLVELYGGDNLFQYLDVIRAVINTLIDYQWGEIILGFTSEVEQLTFRLPLPDRDHTGEFTFEQIVGVLKAEFVKNDGSIDYENANFHQVFWTNMLGYVRKLTGDYDRLIAKTEAEISHTLTFLTDSLKIGNQIESDGVIDPISLSAIDRTDPNRVYYHMASSGTVYLFDRAGLKSYILRTADFDNPCTRTRFSPNDLARIGFTETELAELQRKLAERESAATTRQPKRL